MDEISALNKKLRTQAIICGLLTPIFYFSLLIFLKRIWTSQISYNTILNAIILLLGLLVFFKNKKYRFITMTDTEKIARLKDLLRIFTYAKYFYLICIALLFVGLFKKVSAQIQSCTGEQIAKTFEIRFFTSNTQIQTINLNIHGKEMPFRDDLVIQNADVLKVESIKDSFGKPTLKIVLTASGKEKLSKGTASSVGQLAAVIYDSQVISTPVIRDQIRSGELNTSAENLADICAEKP